jgi:regulatory protein
MMQDTTIGTAILHYCKYQERCHSEVRNKLYELGCTTADVEQYIASLIDAGKLNEERFARAYARGKFRMLGWGREKIKQQLKLRKISDYCIKKAFLEIDEDEYANKLNKYACKKWDEAKKERSVQLRKGKVYRYLVQKGYERDMVLDVINLCIKKI